jgi:hypothetical protein
MPGAVENMAAVQAGQYVRQLLYPRLHAGEARHVVLRARDEHERQFDRSFTPRSEQFRGVAHAAIPVQAPAKAGAPELGAHVRNVLTLAPEWRLLIVTGFLGGLTTFSTLSAEVVAQLMTGRMMWALSTIAVHVAGSIAMTLLGIGTVALLRNSQLAGG